MGEVAGVTSCRPAMLQRGGGGGGGWGDSAPPVVHFISFHNPLQKFTVGGDDGTVLETFCHT